MAPTLSSNSFLLQTTTLTNKNPRFSFLTKRSRPLYPVQLAKSANTSSSEDDDKATTLKSFFSFDFGKATDMKSLIPAITNPTSGISFGGQRRKDPGTVFVAGGSGQAGVRIVQTLLKEGFTVRAGVPDLGVAQELAQFASSYKMISKDELKRLNAVESSFQDPKSIAKAIGNASKLVVTVGPSENGPSEKVTTLDAAQVIEAAQLAGVSHVAVIYDESPSVPSNGNVFEGITSFFSNVFARSQPFTLSELIEMMVQTDLRFTIIKTRLTEDYSPESSYNLVLSAEGNAGANDYKVPVSQIASLVANVFSNIDVAENKVVEVYTDAEAPSRPVTELFSAIPEDGRRKAYADAIAKVKAEEEAKIATERAVEAAEASEKLQREVKNLEAQEAKAASLAEEAKVKAAAAGASVEGLLEKAKGIGSELSWEKFRSQISTAVQKASEKPKVQIATVRGQAKARSLTAKKAVIKQTSPKFPSWNTKGKQKPKTEEVESKPEVRKLFGGMFKQETIYVDDA